MSSETPQAAPRAGAPGFGACRGTRSANRLTLGPLARAGAAVAVTARSEDQLSETVRLIEKEGGLAIARAADVTDHQAVEGVVAEVERQLGPIDLLVNNAGVPSPGDSLWGESAEVWWNVIEVNVRGPLLYCRTVVPGMVARRRGRIINISSRAAYIPAPLVSSYCASKSALTT